MIDLGSIAGLHEHDHQLAAYCPRCDAWRLLPLGEWISQGKGSLRLRMPQKGPTNDFIGGEGGIRTHDPLAGTPVFKTGAFNRSATSPSGNPF